MTEDPPSSPSPSSVSRDVYRALQRGLRLPRLQPSQQLSRDLLTFRLPSIQITSGVAQRPGDSREVRDTVLGEDDVERKDVRSSPSVLMLEALSRKRLDAVRQLHEACPQLLASIPLFDATSGYTAYPSTSQTLRFQLLLNQLRGRSSLSNVSHVPSHHLCHDQTTCPWKNPSTSQAPDDMSDSSTEAPGPSCSFWETNVHICPHRRTSVLLDLAAELRSLLVFVLQNHPDVSRQPGRHHHPGSKPHSNNTRHHSADCCDANSRAALHKSSAFGTESPNSAHSTNDDNDNGEEGFSEESSSNENDDQKDGNPSMDSKITNTVNICIRNNKPDVLHYLLYRHVWDNFLPCNSATTGCSSDDPVPPCSWFLHCAALTGCPALLDLVLCGKFSHQCTPVSPSLGTNDAFSTHGASNLDYETKNKGQPNSLADADNDLNSRSNQQRMQTSVAKAAPGHGFPCVTSYTVTVPAGRLHQAAVPAHCSTSGSETRLHSHRNARDGHVIHTAVTAAKVGQGVSNDDQQQPVGLLSLTNTSRATKHPTASNSTQSVHSFRTHNPQGRGSASLTSVPFKASQSTGTCFQSDARDTTCYGGRAESLTCSRQVTAERQRQSTSLTVPDPNRLMPAFLPVKDFFIPTGTHVRLAPLHLACWRCHPPSIQLLLDHGADVNLLTEQLQCSAAAVRGETSSVDNVDSGLTGFAHDSGSSQPLLGDSSGSDLSETVDGLDSVAGRAGLVRERCVLSPLTALVLGIRSQPRFSLYRGKTLGLVAPSLPQQRIAQIYSGEDPAKHDALEALRCLLEAGCDVNANSFVFGKVVRAMDLLVRPSGEAHSTTYLGTHTILLCSTLERVADTILAVSWHLLAHGGRPSFTFSDCMQWNLPRMDWVRMSDESLRERFLHLAIFLGLFPPLDPCLTLRSHAPEFAGNGGAGFFGRDKSQVAARSSSAYMDLRQSQMSSSSLSDDRAWGIPWTPFPSRIVSSSSLSQTYSTHSDSEEEVEEVQEDQDEGWTGNTNLDSREEDQPDAVDTPAQFGARSQPRLPEEDPSDADSVPSPGFSYPSVTGSGSDGGTSSSGSLGGIQNTANILTRSRLRSDAQRSPALSSSCYNLGTSMVDFWTQRNYQQRCLTKFVEDVLEMAVPPSCQTLIFRFLCLSDLQQLDRIVRRKLRGVSEPSDSPLWALSQAASQAAQPRSLRHTCKLAVLWAVAWSPAHVHNLPVPAAVRHYLLSPE